MKTHFHFYLKRPAPVLVFLLVGEIIFAQTATVSTPLAIGRKTCTSSTGYYNAYNFNAATNKLVQTNATDCTPSLASPGFSPNAGSVAFNPKDQLLYYIETTTGNNSIVYRWSPDPTASCPTGSLVATYTYTSTFVVGLDFSPVDQNGYQIEFSTGSAPYTMYLRQVTSFGPPLVAGSAVVINLPAGKNIYTQNGDLLFTPTGNFYFAYDNKLFSLDYSTYSSGILNAVFIDSLRVGAGNEVVGLAYANGKFIASVSGSSCSYQQIDISSGSAVLTTVPMYASNGTTVSTFSATDMATLITGIGASKNLHSITMASATTYNLVYYIKVRNYGNVNLKNVQVQDSVAKTFGSVFGSATIAAVGTLPSGLTLNPSFDGSTNANIFASGGTMKASPADSAIIAVSVVLNNPNVNTFYYNSAIATATGSLFNNNVRDSSNNSALLASDPNGNDVPDDANEGVPTPLVINGWNILSTNVISFDAARENGNVNLNWVLSNQEPGSIINVQRSPDSRSFETINTLPVTGSDGSTGSYSWKDESPLKSTNYYRLEIIKPGGSIFYSNIIAVMDDNALANSLTVTPNPFHQSVNFSINLPMAANISYCVLDFSSHVIQSGAYSGQSGQNVISINNMDQAPADMYILEVQVGNNRYFRKLVKL